MMPRLTLVLASVGLAACAPGRLSSSARLADGSSVADAPAAHDVPLAIADASGPAPAPDAAPLALLDVAAPDAVPGVSLDAAAPDTVPGVSLDAAAPDAVPDAAAEPPADGRAPDTRPTFPTDAAFDAPATDAAPACPGPPSTASKVHLDLTEGAGQILAAEAPRALRAVWEHAYGIPDAAAAGQAEIRARVATLRAAGVNAVSFLVSSLYLAAVLDPEGHGARCPTPRGTCSAPTWTLSARRACRPMSGTHPWC